MTQPLDIAATPDALTAAWLTAALRLGGHLETAVAVSSVGRRPLGTGQMGDSFRISLRYDGPTNAPLSLVAKLPALDERSRSTAKALRNYEREVRFYQQIAPSLSARIPQAYYADIDIDTGSFAILLEDLSPAQQGDQLAGCTIEVAEAAIAHIVPVHAAHWNDPELHNLTWLLGDPDASRAMLLALLPQLWIGFQDRYRDNLTPAVYRAGEHIFARLDEYLTPQPGPLTITHGDFRLDNLLLTTGSTVEIAGIVDWQTCAIGPGPVDVAYFIGGGLRPDDRRRHEEPLVNAYHQGLIAAGVHGYGWDTCWRDYRRGTWAGFITAVAASMLVARTARGDEMFHFMSDRHAIHALDLDVHLDLG